MLAETSSGFDGNSSTVNAPEGGDISLRLNAGKGEFSVNRDKKTLFTFVLADLSSNPEALWSPDGRAFAVNYSDGGAIGRFHVRVFAIRGDTVRDVSSAIQATVADFESRHYCKTRGKNVVALKWKSVGETTLAWACKTTTSVDMRRLGARREQRGMLMIHDARAPKKRPCSICRQSFRPNERVGPRQHACSKARRKKTQANWRTKNPEYAVGYRIQQRLAREQPPEPLRSASPLSQLPWDLSKDEFGQKGSDFTVLWDHFWCAPLKTSSGRISLIPQELPTHFPLRPKKTSSSVLHTDRDAKDNRHASGVSPTGPVMGAPTSPLSTT